MRKRWAGAAKLKVKGKRDMKEEWDIKEKQDMKETIEEILEL